LNANATAFETENTNNGALARALKVNGRTQFRRTGEGQEVHLLIGEPDQNDNFCEIQTLNSGTNLKLKPQSGTNHISITSVEHQALTVSGGLSVPGDWIAGLELRVTRGKATDYLEARQRLLTGDHETDGKVDHASTGAGNRILKIGTDNAESINISRLNKTTTVKGGLVVDQNANVGSLNVVAGMIMESGEINAENGEVLNLGSGNPNAGDVLIGRSGRTATVDALLYARRRLYVDDIDGDGHSEIKAYTTGNPASKALEVKNESSHSQAVALGVSGHSTFSAFAVDDPASTGVTIYNESTNANAAALDIVGQSFMSINPAGNPPSKALTLSNQSTNADARALKASGISEFDGRVIIDDLDAEVIAFETENSDINAGSRALKAKGHSEIVANSADNPASKALEIINTSSNAAAIALDVQGLSIFDGKVRVGPSDGDGLIDSNGTTGTPRSLLIGSQDRTKQVKIGNIGQHVQVEGGLLVGGDNLAPAIIDATLDGVSSRVLAIGTQSTTDDLEIGRSGKISNVKSQLTVGPGLAAGSIDANGTGVTPENLKVGTDSITDDVIIGNGSGIINLKQKTRINNKEVVLNTAESVTSTNTGCGLVFNDTGHGNGDAIDFYTEGVLRGYIDQNGWTNA